MSRIGWCARHVPYLRRSRWSRCSWSTASSSSRCRRSPRAVSRQRPECNKRRRRDCVRSCVPKNFTGCRPAFSQRVDVAERRWDGRQKLARRCGARTRETVACREFWTGSPSFASGEESFGRPTLRDRRIGSGPQVFAWRGEGSVCTCGHDDPGPCIPIHFASSRLLRAVFGILRGGRFGQSGRCPRGTCAHRVTVVLGQVSCLPCDRRSAVLPAESASPRMLMAQLKAH